MNVFFGGKQPRMPATTWQDKVQHLVFQASERPLYDVPAHALGSSSRARMKLLHLRMAHFSERKIAESIKYGAILADDQTMRSVTALDDAAACHGCLEGTTKRPSKKRNEES